VRPMRTWNTSGTYYVHVLSYIHAKSAHHWKNAMHRVKWHSSYKYTH
jgi:transposase-like protein